MKIHFRECVSGFTHLFGAILMLFGTIWLAALTWDNSAQLVVMLIFGISMLAIYVSSSALHLLDGPESFIRRLRCYDHAAIYLGIAGSYTPLIYHTLIGNQRVLMLALVWLLALIGVVSKLFFFWEGHLSTLFYILMGWVGLLFSPAVLAHLAMGAIIMILIGGMAYLIGAIIYALRKPNIHVHFGHHEVWHLLVMTGTGIHFAVIVRYLI